MQCPTCVKMQLEPSYYCSQECFKALWKFHKMVHKKREERIESGFKFTGPLRPFPYSFAGHREIPKHIKGPDYAKTGAPSAHFQQIADKAIPVHTPEQIELIRESCRVARGAIDAGHSVVKPGVTTEEIDRVVHEYIIS